MSSNGKVEQGTGRAILTSDSVAVGKDRKGNHRPPATPATR